MAPPDDLRATLSPGAVVTGETVTVDVTSPADVDKLTVEVVEVDQGTLDEPKKGADALVARFTGKVEGGLFTLVPSGTPAKPNPELNPRPGDNAPKIKLSIGGSDHEVLLPGRENENGI